MCSPYMSVLTPKYIVNDGYLGYPGIMQPRASRTFCNLTKEVGLRKLKASRLYYMYFQLLS